MKFLQVLMLAALAAAHRPSVFLIRHGEKPLDKENHHLSDKGRQRAQCLRRVFSADSHYDITKIMVEKRRKNGSRIRPFDTVAPLARDLGIEIDDSCEQLDARCVKRAIKKHKGRGNVLICWEHKGLSRIIKKLGVKGNHQYPSKSFNLIWSVHHPYSSIASVASENCPGLDHRQQRGKKQRLLDHEHEHKPLDGDDIVDVGIEDRDDDDYSDDNDDDDNDWLELLGISDVDVPSDEDEQIYLTPASTADKQEDL